MDKVLAFSILSASPADIAAGAGVGLGGRWPRLSWRRSSDDDQAAARARPQRDGAPSHAGKEKATREEEKNFPRFAPEFDGIDCFETIVSH